jgi:hypothetical protein
MDLRREVKPTQDGSYKLMIKRPRLEGEIKQDQLAILVLINQGC